MPVGPEFEGERHPVGPGYEVPGRIELPGPRVAGRVLPGRTENAVGRDEAQIAAAGELVPGGNAVGDAHFPSRSFDIDVAGHPGEAPPVDASGVGGEAEPHPVLQAIDGFGLRIDAVDALAARPAEPVGDGEAPGIERVDRELREAPRIHAHDGAPPGSERDALVVLREERVGRPVFDGERQGFARRHRRLPVDDPGRAEGDLPGHEVRDEVPDHPRHQRHRAQQQLYRRPAPPAPRQRPHERHRAGDRQRRHQPQRQPLEPLRRPPPAPMPHGRPGNHHPQQKPHPQQPRNRRKPRGIEQQPEKPVLQSLHAPHFASPAPPRQARPFAPQARLAPASPHGRAGARRRLFPLARGAGSA